LLSAGALTVKIDFLWKRIILLSLPKKYTREKKMKRRFFLGIMAVLTTFAIVCVLGCTSDGSASGASKEPPLISLTVKPDEELHQISDLLYGIFIEDINFAADGGLYGELVANRSFEFTRLAKDDGFYGYQKVGTDSLGNDIIEFDAVTGTYPDSDMQNSLVTENYTDRDDYVNTRRMSRFDGYVGLGYYPWYTYDPWYGWYDPWFYGPHRWYAGWYGWYDPWYGYYSPWRYHYGWYAGWGNWYYSGPVYVGARGNAGYGSSRITRHGRSDYVSGKFSGYRGHSSTGNAKATYSRNSDVRRSRASSERNFDYNRSNTSTRSYDAGGFNRSHSSYGGGFGGSRSSSGGSFGGSRSGGSRSGGSFGGRR